MLVATFIATILFGYDIPKAVYEILKYTQCAVYIAIRFNFFK